MRDLINARAAQLKRVQSKEDAVRASVREIADALTNAFSHMSLSGKSATVRLDAVPDGDVIAVTLNLRFDRDRLLVIARTVNPAMPRALQESEWWPDDCSTRWLEALFTDEVVGSLITSIGGDDLDDKESKLDGTLAAVRAMLSSEAAAIDTEMVDSLTTAGDENLSRLWQDAVEATRTDSADALTRCSRFLEAVCAKVLRERGVALPKDKSMSPLVKACLETLTWPAEKEAEEDVKKLLGGIQSITQGIGALRTHFGTAHGATSHLPPLDPGYVVFVKQATVAAATFLLDRHQAIPLAVDDSGPAPAG
ncbi:abortive infection family protein [Burkholderia gladioli]|uniref:abortive infection family protein n=1 Tax=Burkholderia gladioli TaxID=28095 RepID=UPI00163FC4FF|nr:abortive infection family protein [Burkholderia gladioli]